MELGAAIKRVRLESGATQEVIALEAGTFAGNLSKIERGQQLPSLELLVKIATALNVKLSDLFAMAEAGEVVSGKEKAVEHDNVAILLRRHFLTLNSQNQRLAVELLKTMNRLQDEAVHDCNRC